LARFELAPGQVAHAVMHRTVEEIWFVLAGRGEMWRRQGEREELASLHPGVCLTIPRGTRFQVRAVDEERLSAIVVTMPPWPDDDEAVIVNGCWQPDDRPG
jgi:mannose-6-phosphate isomerase-like protein (cupin superfamily)